MKKQYLHLSTYSCDKCRGPVVSGFIAVRENEISKETGTRQVGAICLSCGHRQNKATEPGRARHLPQIEWGPVGAINAGDPRTAFVETRSIMQNYVEQRTVDLESALYASGIMDKTQLPEPVHEKANPRTRGSDHLSQRFLTDLGDDRFRNSFFAEVGKQEEHAGQSLFAGVEKLINQVLFIADVSGQ